MDTKETDATDDTLMRRAAYTVVEHAIAIRSSMGEDWCDKNPDAFSRLVLAATVDYHGSIVGRELGRLAEAHATKVAL